MEQICDENRSAISCITLLTIKKKKMKKINLLFTCLLLTQFINAQSFQEICASSTTNGTVVDCEYFIDTLYATGCFSTICGESVGYIAKWEDNEWKPSSINISDPGHSLTTINDQLYIAKYEESIDSNWVYIYDGTGLQKMGEGVYLTTASGFSELPNIYDIIEYDEKIIACGEFDRVGEESIQGIMQWNGNSWEALGLGLNGNIAATAPVMFPHQMLVHNDELYIGGNFKNAGGMEVNGIAKWDGSNWSALGAGFNNTVYSISVFNNEIIAGGSFTESDGTTLNRIAKWDGASWVPLDFGFTQSSTNDFIFVHTLKVIDNVLYIGGGLKEIEYSDNSTEVCNGIVSYSENTINTFIGGVPGFDIEAICELENDQLLIGGGVFGTGYSGITDINTNTFESNLDESVSIAPNPFTESIYIDITSTIEKYEIINQMGQLLVNNDFENNIQLSLPAGIYFLKLYNNNKLHSTHKIVRMDD